MRRTVKATPATGGKAMDIRVKRIYDAATDEDGYRVLVDRVWPRGMSKEKASIDEWARDLAPSTALRRWFAHDPERWAQFEARYADELATQREAIAALLARAQAEPVTILYGARDRDHNNAVALRLYLERHAAGCR